MIETLKTLKKALAAASGLVGELITLGLLHGTAETVATAVIGAATAALVYLVPNEPVLPPIVDDHPLVVPPIDPAPVSEPAAG